MKFTVYRVHWLRSKASRDRWKEELDLLPHEMEWVIYFFRHKSAEWKELGLSAKIPGKVCYAARQAAMWAEFDARATATFQQVVGLPVGSRQWALDS